MDSEELGPVWVELAQSVPLFFFFSVVPYLRYKSWNRFLAPEGFKNEAQVALEWKWAVLFSKMQMTVWEGEGDGSV